MNPDATPIAPMLTQNTSKKLMSYLREAYGD